MKKHNRIGAFRSRKGNGIRTLRSFLTGKFIEYTIVMTLALIATVFLLYTVIAWSDNEQVIQIDSEGRAAITENYANANYKDIFGSNSFVYVINSSGDTIFSVDNDFERNEYVRDYSKLEQALIPEIDSFVFVDTVNAKKGSWKYSVISMSGTEATPVSDQYFFDKEYRVVFASKPLPLGRRQLTKKEFNLFLGEVDKNIIVNRCSFTDKNGEKLKLIVLKNVETVSIVSQYYWLVALVFFLLFLVGLFFITWAFVVAIDKKISKPIGQLKEALDIYSEGQMPEKNEYRGISYFKEMFDCFDKMVLRIDESEKQKHEMLADISHDLKTPITVIQGYTRALNDGIIADEEKTQYINAVNEKADALNELINKFYDYSKLSHPQFYLKKERIDIVEFFRQYLIEQYNDFKICDVTLEADIPDVHAYAMLDAEMMRRAFANIIGNSIKHNVAGIKVFASIRVEENQAIILLGDNGRGISEEISENIFNPFVTDNESRNKIGSSGLGLSISKKVVEMHGGELFYENSPKPPYKTCFKFIIPLTEEI